MQSVVVVILYLAVVPFFVFGVAEPRERAKRGMACYRASHPEVREFAPGERLHFAYFEYDDPDHPFVTGVTRTSVLVAAARFTAWRTLHPIQAAHHRRVLERARRETARKNRMIVEFWADPARVSALNKALNQARRQDRNLDDLALLEIAEATGEPFEVVFPVADQYRADAARAQAVADTFFEVWRDPDKRNDLSAIEVAEATGEPLEYVLTVLNAIRSAG